MELPPEVIFLILNWLCTDWPSFCALAVSNSQFLEYCRTWVQREFDQFARQLQLRPSSRTRLRRLSLKDAAPFFSQPTRVAAVMVTLDCAEDVPANKAGFIVISKDGRIQTSCTTCFHFDLQEAIHLSPLTHRLYWKKGKSPPFPVYYAVVDGPSPYVSQFVGLPAILTFNMSGSYLLVKNASVELPYVDVIRSNFRSPAKEVLLRNWWFCYKEAKHLFLHDVYLNDMCWQLRCRMPKPLRVCRAGLMEELSVKSLMWNWEDVASKNK